MNIRTSIKLLFIAMINLFLGACEPNHAVNNSVTDQLPPLIESIDPLEKSTLLDINPIFTIRFNEPIDPSSTVNSIIISSAILGNVSLSIEQPEPDTVLVKPFSSLFYHTEYTFSITTELKDLSGNPLERRYDQTFSTIKSPVDILTKASPMGGIFRQPQLVSLTCLDNNSESCDDQYKTYYTLDETSPYKKKHLYNEPISISKNATIKYYSTNDTDILEPLKVDSYIIDEVPPTPYSSFTSGIFQSAQTIVLVCDDNPGGSGCQGIYYTNNGEEPTTSSMAYNEPIIISESQTIKYIAADYAGNISETRELSITVDNKPPKTSVINNKGGIFNSSQQIQLECSDASGSGCYSTFYSLDLSSDPSDFILYDVNSPIEISETLTLRYYSRDIAGNVESIVQTPFIIDSIPPIASSSTLSGAYNTSVSVNLYCDDGQNGTGCATLYYAISVNDILPTNWTVYKSPIVVAESGYLFFYATDNAGNMSSETTKLFFIIDKIPPTTTSSHPSGSYKLINNITLSCNDINSGNSGCAKTYYSLATVDSQALFLEYPVSGIPFSMPSNGEETYTLKFYSIDNAGNKEVTHTIQYVIDNITPNSSVSPETGIYRNHVSVHLTCQDNLSGCADTSYRIGEIGEFVRYNQQQTIFIDASTNIHFFSSDRAGNVETVKIADYTIDNTSPVTTPDHAPGNYPEAITVSLNCEDFGGSSCGNTFYSINNIEWISYTAPIVVPNNTELRYYSLDTLGNSESIKLARYTIDTTAPFVVAAPVDRYHNKPLTVELTCEDGNGSGCNSIYYSLSTSETSPGIYNVYEGPIAVTNSSFLWFYGIDLVNNSGFNFPGMVQYIVDSIAPTTIPFPNGGLFNSPIELTFTCHDLGDAQCLDIFYATETNGVINSFTKYSPPSPINILQDSTIYYYSTDKAGNIETTGSSSYLIDIIAPVSTIYPNGGIFNSQKQVTITCVDNRPDNCISVYYKILPNTEFILYESPILLTSSAVIQYYGIDTAGNTESIHTSNFTIDSTIPESQATPFGGVYSNPVSITLTCNTGPVLSCDTFYTIDGSQPTVYSNKYTGAPIPITQTTQLKFFSVNSAATNEDPFKLESYTIDTSPPIVHANITPGIYNHNLSLKLTCTDDVIDGCANIFYTLDGTTPDSSSNRYSTPIILIEEKQHQVTFFAKDKSGRNSEIVSLSYTIDKSSPNVNSDNPGGVFATQQTVSLSCTDSASPTCSVFYSKEPAVDVYIPYNAPIVINSDNTIRFYSEDTAGNRGETQLIKFTIDKKSPETSLIYSSGEPKQYHNSPIGILLSCSDFNSSGCKTTYYTTDTVASNPTYIIYTSPITISSTTTLRYYSVDNVGNTENLQQITFTIDTSAPTTTASFAEGTYNTSIEVSLHCVDTGPSGCDLIYYKLPEDPAPVLYTSPVAINKSTSLSFYSTDMAGNREPTNTVGYLIDTTPPQTNITPASGAYNTPIIINLTCTDSSGGSGCSDIYYDKGTGVTRYTEPFLVEESSTIMYYSIDVAQNIESINVSNYTIDMDPPSTTISVPGGNFNYDVQISFSCNDNIIGCDVTYYRFNSGNLLSYVQGEVITLTQSTSLEFFSVDKLANTEQANIEQYIIDKIAPTASASPAGGVYITAQRISLSCTDEGGSNCLNTHYRTFNGSNYSEWILYTSPISLNSDTALEYYSTDHSGNVSQIYSQNYIIDLIPPRIVEVTPLSSPVSIDVKPSITFSESINNSTINTSTVSLTNGDTYIPIRLSYDDTTYTVTVTPIESLSYDAVYMLTLSKQIEDAHGNTMADIYTTTLTTPAPQQLSTPSPALHTKLNMSYDSANEGVMVWEVDTGTGSKVYYATHNGEQWSSGSALTENQARSPSIASNGSDFMITYIQEGNVYAVRYSNGSVEAPILVEQLTNTSFSPVVTTNGSDYLVAWRQTIANGTIVYSSIYKDGKWSNPVLVYGSNGGIQDIVSLTSNRTSYALAWTGNIGNNTTVLLTSIYSNGTWSTPVQVDTTDTALNIPRNPRIASNGSGYALVWQKKNTFNEYEIYANVFDNETWNGEELIGTAGTNQDGLRSAHSPAIASDGFGYAVTWFQYDQNWKAGIYATKFDSTKQWGPTIIIADNLPNSINPTISPHESDYLVSWHRHNELTASSDIFIARFDGTYLPNNHNNYASLQVDSGPEFTEADPPILSNNGINTTVAWPTLDTFGSSNVATLDFAKQASSITILLSEQFTASSFSAELATTADGNSLVVWNKFSNGKLIVEGMIVSANALKSAPFTITTNGSMPLVQTVGSDYIVMWINGNHLSSRQITSSGNQSPIVDVATIGSGYVTDYNLVQFSNKVLVAWQQNNSGTMDIYSAEFMLSDGLWKNTQPMEETPGNARNPELTVISGYTILSWEQHNGTEYVLNLSTYNGTAWTSSASPAYLAGNANQSALACLDSDCALIWLQQSASGSQSDLYTARLSDTGWSQPMLMESESSPIFNPRIAAFGNGYVASWLVQKPLSSDLAVRMMRNNTWQQTAMLESGAGNVIVYDISTTVDGISLLWQQMDKNRSNIYIARWVDGLWSPIKVLEQRPENNLNPKIRQTDNGINAVWVQENISDSTIRSIYGIFGF